MEVYFRCLMLVITAIVLLIAALVLPKLIYAEICFCRVNDPAFSCSESTSCTDYCVTIPTCGDTGYESCGYCCPDEPAWCYSAVPTTKYWDDVLGRWSFMSGVLAFRSTEVHLWYVELPVCPANNNEPLEDCNDDDADGDGIPDLCDPWPNTDNTNDMFENWALWSNGGLEFRPPGSTEDGFQLGDCTGDLSLVIGGPNMSLADIMSAGCDCNSPTDFAVVPYSPPVAPLADLPDSLPSTPPVPSGGLSPGGGQSGGAESTPQTAQPETTTINLTVSGGQSGNAISTPLQSFPSLDLSSVENNTASTSQNTEQLVEGQNHVRDYLDSVQQNTLNIAKNVEASANNTAQLVQGQNDVRDYLDSVQQNTLNAANNAEVIAGNTEQLVEGQNDLRENLANIQNSAAQAAAGIGEVVDNTEEIADLLQEQIDNEQGQSEGEQTAADGALGEYQTAAGSGNYTNYGSSDVPDTDEAQTDYETSVQGVKDSSGISSAASQVGVDLSGAVTHMDVNIWGYDIVFDFSKWESFYDLVGVAFLSLCYLLGFMMIVRG